MAGIRAYLRHRANAQLADIDEHIQGKQYIDELIKQNQGVSSMVVGDEGIRTFERIAKKYGVDFAVMKDKAENPPVYTAFFKARDTDAMAAVVNEYSMKMMKMKERPSVLKKLQKFIEIAKKEPLKNRNRAQEMTKKQKRFILLNIPYVLVGVFATNLGEAWRLAQEVDAVYEIGALAQTLPVALSNLMPSFVPFDLMVGIFCGVLLKVVVYVKGKNAKKYRHGAEYGTARWDNAQDIEPFVAPNFKDNIILTQTERLMMNSRPKRPKYARNKNVLVTGGSGSGKTRFFLIPNLLQMHSSYVVTDPKGDVVINTGKTLLRHGYKVKIFHQFQ